MTTLCGDAMDGNDDVTCQRVDGHDQPDPLIRLPRYRVHRAFVAGEGVYEWDADDVHLVSRP